MRQNYCSDFIKDPEGLFEVLRRLLVGLPPPHQLDELGEVHGAGAVRVRLLDRAGEERLTSIMSSSSSCVGLLPAQRR